jgi:hypothetical protein
MIVVLVMTVIYIQKNLFYPLNIFPMATPSYSEFQSQVISQSIDR